MIGNLTQVVDQVGSDGRDTLENIELIRFAGGPAPELYAYSDGSWVPVPEPAPTFGAIAVLSAIAALRARRAGALRSGTSLRARSGPRR